MNFTFLCLVITQYLFLAEIQALYNKDVLCIIDKGEPPKCDVVPNSRKHSIRKNILPSHDPYIPRANPIFYNCSSTDCEILQLYSMTQVTSPDLILKSCHGLSDAYTCETVRYNYFNNIDKLLFLKNNIRGSIYYLVDCLVYADQSLICHKKKDATSHTHLVNTGVSIRPGESGILAQDEFLCEETTSGLINCDVNPFVPYNSGLKKRTLLKTKGDVFLNTHSNLVVLKLNCVGTWCGFSGLTKSTRRFVRYEPPGDSIYRCYYAKKQQICKVIGKKVNEAPNNWRNVLQS